MENAGVRKLQLSLLAVPARGLKEESLKRSLRVIGPASLFPVIKKIIEIRVIRANWGAG